MSFGLSFSDSLLGGFVRLLAGNDLSLASGWFDVRNSNVDLLGDDSSVYFLVDNDTDGALVDVEHNTGTTVVVLERHTLVDGRVNLDVNIVTSLRHAAKQTTNASSHVSKGEDNERVESQWHKP